jgi:hypothetical protein
METRGSRTMPLKIFKTGLCKPMWMLVREKW